MTLATKSGPAYECLKASAIWATLYLVAVLPLAPRPTVGHAVLVVGVLLLFLVGVVDPWGDDGRAGA